MGGALVEDGSDSSQYFHQHGGGGVPDAESGGLVQHGGGGVQAGEYRPQMDMCLGMMAMMGRMTQVMDPQEEGSGGTGGAGQFNRVRTFLG